MNDGTTTSSPGCDAERPQRDRDRVGAVADADHVADAEVVGELALERLHLGTEDERAALDDLADPGEDRLAQRRERRVGVEQGNRSWRT